MTGDQAADQTIDLVERGATLEWLTVDTNLLLLVKKSNVRSEIDIHELLESAVEG